MDLYTNDAILTKVMVEFLDALYIKHKEIVNQNKDYVGKYGKINPREKKFYSSGITTRIRNRYGYVLKVKQSLSHSIL